MTKTIVVTGVTGIQGSSVAETFRHLPDWKVRGITRNPLGSAAQALASKGVEVVKGDFDDAESLKAAFEGANVIFSNTDYFAHLFGAISSPEISGGREPMQYGYDREVEQGSNVAEAASSPTVLKTLERFIYSSLSDARKWSHGKYTGVYHYESKAETERVIRARFPAVAAKMSTVQIGNYQTNWKMFPAQAPQKQQDGTYEIQRVYDPEFVNPFVDAERDTGAFVKALVDLPAGTNLLGVSEFLTWPEYAKIWGEVHGVPTVYRKVSYDEHFRDAPDPFKRDLSEGFSYMAEFGHTGGDPSVHTAKELGVEIPVTSVKEYIEREDWSSVIQ